MNNPQDELSLKAACLTYLIRQHNLSTKDHIIINELKFGDGKRRADLTEVNDDLNAYEIKSDLDKLDTLLHQIEDYKRCFDTVTVVTTEKHLSKIREMIPKKVGILIYKNGNISCLRKPQKYTNFNKYYLASFINTKYIDKILREKGQCVKLSITLKRKYVANNISCGEIKKLAAISLRSKYKLKHDRLINYTKNDILVDDVLLLDSLLISSI